MTIDKRMSYVNQDGYKNYTKNSDSVTVPRKFKSRADATPTKLAYITAAEEKQLKKQNPGTPHKGPTGIPSYDDFDAQGNYRSGAAMSAAETGAKTERARADLRQAGISPQEAQNIRAAAINAGAGQRVNPGFFDSRTTLSPADIALAKAYRKDPANKYARQAYRNTRGSGLMNFIQGGGLLGNLLSGLGSFFGLGKRYDEPTYDMSEGNTLGLYNERVNPTYYNDLGNEFALGTTPPASKQYYGVGPVPPSDKYKYSRGPQEVNLPGPYETAADDYWSNKVIGPNGIVFNTDTGMEVVDEPMGTPWDNPYQESKKGIMETLSDWNPLNLIFGSPAGAAEMTQGDLLNLGAMKPGMVYGHNLTDQGEALEDFRNSAVNFYNSPNNSAKTAQSAYDFMMGTNPNMFKNVKEHKDYIQGAINEGFLGDESDYTNQKPLDEYLARGGRVGYANGGLASLFNRRG